MPGVLLWGLARQVHWGSPLAGVLLCKSVHQALKGAPWVGSYSVVQHIRHLMGQPLCCSPVDAGMWGERGYGAGFTPLPMTVQYHLASLAAQLSSTGISHHSLLPHIPSIHLSVVNSSPHPWIIPHSLNSSSERLCLPGNLHPCLAYLWWQQELSGSHSI